MHTHLTQEQRNQVSLLLRLNYSQRAAAAVLGVSPSTICRELKRNSQTIGDYPVC
jgi:IS30 family transposase